MDTRSFIMTPQVNPRFPGSLKKAVDFEIRKGLQNLDPSNAMDLKKLRRLVSNRLSAQRCRKRKTQHIQDLEKLIEDLQVFKLIVTPRVQENMEKVNLLMKENQLLQNQVQKLSYEKNLQELKFENLQAKVTKLKELEHGLKLHVSVPGLEGLQDDYKKLRFYQEVSTQINYEGLGSSNLM